MSWTALAKSVRFLGSSNLISLLLTEPSPPVTSEQARSSCPASGSRSSWPTVSAVPDADVLVLHGLVQVRGVPDEPACPLQHQGHVRHGLVPLPLDRVVGLLGRAAPARQVGVQQVLQVAD